MSDRAARFIQVSDKTIVSLDHIVAITSIESGDKGGAGVTLHMPDEYCVRVYGDDCKALLEAVSLDMVQTFRKAVWPRG